MIAHACVPAGRRMQAVASQDSTFAGCNPTSRRHQRSVLLLGPRPLRGLDLQTAAQGLDVHASLPASKARAGDGAAGRLHPGVGSAGLEAPLLLAALLVVVVGLLVGVVLVGRLVLLVVLVGVMLMPMLVGSQVLVRVVLVRELVLVEMVLVGRLALVLVELVLMLMPLLVGKPVRIGMGLVRRLVLVLPRLVVMLRCHSPAARRAATAVPPRRAAHSLPAAAAHTSSAIPVPSLSSHRSAVAATAATAVTPNLSQSSARAGCHCSHFSHALLGRL